MKLKVAAYQGAPATDLEKRKTQIHNILQRAEAEGLDFLCLPEGFLTGYYMEETEARKNSLVVGEVAFLDWLQMFRNCRSTVIVGFNEREGHHLFDSAAVIEEGKLLGIQRKHYLYHNYFTSGASFKSLSSKGIIFGVVICLDTNYFEPARLLALQGASLLFSPQCNKVSLDHSYARRPPYYSHFVARTHENRCWLVSADWIWKDDTSVCPGHTVIYDPDGQEMARSQEGVAQFLRFDIPRVSLMQEKGRRVHGSGVLSRERASSNESCVRARNWRSQ